LTVKEGGVDYRLDLVVLALLVKKSHQLSHGFAAGLVLCEILLPNFIGRAFAAGLRKLDRRLLSAFRRLL
jgi:hypothetical protein